MGLAVPKNHPLSGKAAITREDLAGERIRVIQSGWSRSTDKLRAWLESIEDLRIDNVSVYDSEAFTQTVLQGIPLATFDAWRNVHPKLSFVPFEEAFFMPYGLCHAESPSSLVLEFVAEIERLGTAAVR